MFDHDLMDVTRTEVNLPGNLPHSKVFEKMTKEEKAIWGSEVCLLSLNLFL
jgi:hypothetical protein